VFGRQNRQHGLGENVPPNRVICRLPHRLELHSNAQMRPPINGAPIVSVVADRGIDSAALPGMTAERREFTGGLRAIPGAIAGAPAETRSVVTPGQDAPD